MYYLIKFKLIQVPSVFNTGELYYRLVVWDVVVVTMPTSFKSSVVTTVPTISPEMWYCLCFLIFLHIESTSGFFPSTLVLILQIRDSAMSILTVQPRSGEVMISGTHWAPYEVWPYQNSISHLINRTPALTGGPWWHFRLFMNSCESRFSVPESLKSQNVSPSPVHSLPGKQSEIFGEKDGRVLNKIYFWCWRGVGKRKAS